MGTAASLDALEADESTDRPTAAPVEAPTPPPLMLSLRGGLRTQQFTAKGTTSTLLRHTPIADRHHPKQFASSFTDFDHPAEEGSQSAPHLIPVSMNMRRTELLSHKYVNAPDRGHTGTYQMRASEEEPDFWVTTARSRLRDAENTAVVGPDRNLPSDLPRHNDAHMKPPAPSWAHVPNATSAGGENTARQTTQLQPLRSVAQSSIVLGPPLTALSKTGYKPQYLAPDAIAEHPHTTPAQQNTLHGDGADRGTLSAAPSRSGVGVSSAIARAVPATRTSARSSAVVGPRNHEAMQAHRHIHEMQAAAADERITEDDMQARIDELAEARCRPIIVSDTIEVGATRPAPLKPPPQVPAANTTPSERQVADLSIPDIHTARDSGHDLTAKSSLSRGRGGSAVDRRLVREHARGIYENGGGAEGGGRPPRPAPDQTSLGGFFDAGPVIQPGTKTGDALTYYM